MFFALVPHSGKTTGKIIEKAKFSYYLKAFGAKAIPLRYEKMGLV